MTQLLGEVDTVFTADTVEWCPVPGLEGVVACGTYQLNQHEGSSTRLGSLLLFLWDGSKLSRILESTTAKYSFGILDMKCIDANCRIAGKLVERGVYWHLQLREFVLTDLGAVKVGEESQKGQLHLSLSLDWGTETNCVAVSDSLGRVGVVELSDSGPRLTRLWKAHGYEAWITCFGPGEEGVVFSGGDDCKLCMWDLRVGTSAPLSTSRWHGMGVCSLQVSPDGSVLGSGSYDERLALWDVRSMATPLKELSLGGGVWRVKWQPHSAAGLLAAACMHNHLAVVETRLGSGEPMEVVGRYKGHTSLAYGVDWCRRSVKETLGEQETSSTTYTLASCSFYDHSMHIWQL